jgi:hypothetical protein
MRALIPTEKAGALYRHFRRGCLGVVLHARLRAGRRYVPERSADEGGA